MAPQAPAAGGFAPAPGGFAPGGAPAYGGGFRRREGPAGGPGGRRPGGRYAPRRRVCMFCVDKVKYIDYKDIGRLRRFVSDRAKIEPRRKSGVCASHQRDLSEAIKRARHLALLPFDPEQSRTTGWTG